MHVVFDDFQLYSRLTDYKSTASCSALLRLADRQPPGSTLHMSTVCPSHGIAVHFQEVHRGKRRRKNDMHLSFPLREGENDPSYSLSVERPRLETPECPTTE